MSLQTSLIFSHINSCTQKSLHYPYFNPVINDSEKQQLLEHAKILYVKSTSHSHYCPVLHKQPTVRCLDKEGSDSLADHILKLENRSSAHNGHLQSCTYSIIQNKCHHAGTHPMSTPKRLGKRKEQNAHSFSMESTSATQSFNNPKFDFFVPFISLLY